MNRKVPLTFFFLTYFLCSDYASAQQSKTENIDFASTLLAAKTLQERRQLLESNNHLVTPELVQALIEKGNQFRINGEYSEARTTFELAKNLAESLNDPSGAAEALNGIGVIHYMMSEFNAALENLNKSLKLSETTGNQSGIAQSLNHIGRVHYMQDNYDVALDYYQKSLSIRESLKDSIGIAESLNSIGLIYYLRAESTKALEYLKRSLALREELKDDEAIAASLNNIGLVEKELGNNESATNNFKKSLSIREKLRDKAGIALVVSSLGSVQIAQGNYKEALEHYQRGLKIYEELGNKLQMADTLGTIGQIYQSQGHYRLALESYQKSLKLNEQIGQKSGVAHTLNMIGMLHSEQGNNKVALEYHKKGLQLSEELKDKRESSNALLLMGHDYRMEGDSEKALECYQKGLAITEEIQHRYVSSLLLNSIADVQSEMGNLELARKHLDQSLEISQEIGNKLATVDALNAISTIQYEKGDYIEALDFADRSVRLAKTIGTHPRLWISLTNLSKAYKVTHQIDMAIQFLQEAVATIETLRMNIAGSEQEQQRYFENSVIPYNMLVDLFVEKGGMEAQAFAYAERAKARALLDVLQKGRTTITGAMTREELDQEQNLIRKLISLNQRVHQAKLGNKETELKELTASLEKARLNMDEFRANIYGAHPELKAQRGEAEIVTPARLNELLPDPTAAFLEYVVTPEKTLLFVITKTENHAPVHTKVYTINVLQRDLSSRISNFRKQMASRHPDFRKEASDLHNLLIAPASAILQTKHNLVIVADDVLWKLPFQALLSPEGRYLLQDYSLSYVPSLTVLNEMKKLKKKKSASQSIKLFAMGNPSLETKVKEQVKQVYRDANLDPLPQAEIEVMELAKLYGDQQSTIYIGANAREDRVKSEAERYNFLHLATHGLLNDATPLYSQILLAQSTSQEEDGMLEAWEILNLKLNADLVVLSACDTAMGKVGRGEGMIGLTWALFVAGVPTTVVSQWTVDSNSTTELMIQFHKRLRSNLSDSTSKSPVPDALRAAALNLLQTDEYRHPFYWAPFVVIGAGF